MLRSKEVCQTDAACEGIRFYFGGIQINFPAFFLVVVVGCGGGVGGWGVRFTIEVKHFICIQIMNLHIDKKHFHIPPSPIIKLT